MRFFGKRAAPAVAPPAVPNMYPPQEPTTVQAIQFDRQLQAQTASAIPATLAEIPSLFELTKSADWPVRREAAVAIASLGEDRGLLLLDGVILDDPDQEHRVDGIIAMARVHDASKAGNVFGMPLKTLLTLAGHAQHHADERVRAAATWCEQRGWEMGSRVGS